MDAGASLPYIDSTDLLVYKINSCGIRPTPDQKMRDATDAAELLKLFDKENHPPLTDQ